MRQASVGSIKVKRWNLFSFLADDYINFFFKRARALNYQATTQS